MYMRTDDPIADYERYIEAQEQKLEMLPKCSCCDEPIQQEKAVCHEGKWWCEDCEMDFLDIIREDFLELTEFN